MQQLYTHTVIVIDCEIVGEGNRAERVKKKLQHGLYTLGGVGTASLDAIHG